MWSQVFSKIVLSVTSLGAIYGFGYSYNLDELRQDYEVLSSGLPIGSWIAVKKQFRRIGYPTDVKISPKIYVEDFRLKRDGSLELRVDYQDGLGKVLHEVEKNTVHVSRLSVGKSLLSIKFAEFTNFRAQCDEESYENITLNIVLTASEGPLEISHVELVGEYGYTKDNCYNEPGFERKKITYF